jgi:hypothetical protein
MTINNDFFYILYANKWKKSEGKDSFAVAFMNICTNQRIFEPSGFWAAVLCFEMKMRKKI